MVLQGSGLRRASAVSFLHSVTSRLPYACDGLPVVVIRVIPPSENSTSGKPFGAIYNVFSHKLDVEALSMYNTHHQADITSRHGGTPVSMKKTGGFASHFGIYPFYYVHGIEDYRDEFAHTCSNSSGTHLMPLTRQMTPQPQTLQAIYGVKEGERFTPIRYGEAFQE